MPIKKKKKEKLSMTQEQKREQELKDIQKRLFLLPEPTHFYNVGDRVSMGNLEDVYVNKIFNNGKIYEIDYTSIDNNYGKPIKIEHCKMFVTWVDIRKYQENNDSFIQNDDLRLYYSQRDINDILIKAYHFGIDFDPEYQRNYVWELEDKINLIDSIFNNVDIGKFVFVHMNFSNKYLYQVLDGKQRTRAILDFYEDRYQYQGKYFSDLSWRDQIYFKSYPIVMAEVRDITRKQVLRYFIKLNTGGKIMSKEQINRVRKLLEEIES